MRHVIDRRTALTGGLALGLTGLATAAGCAPEPAPAPPRTGSATVTAVVGATVIDAGHGGRRGDHTVLVRGDRIAAVGPTSAVAVPHGAKVLDGRGRYLIPGLTDLHVHSVPMDAIFPPLYLANGVTTVREMSGNPAARAMRDRVARGAFFGPRTQVASTLVDGKPSLWEGIGPPYISVAGAADARAVVRSERTAGADFIKTYTRLGRAAYTAIVDECRRLNLPFLGHCPDAVSVREASDAGHRTLEHLFQFWYATSSREAQLRAQVAAVPITGGEYGGWYTKMHPLEYAAARSLDPRKAQDLFAHLAGNRTWVTPTLVQHRVADVPGAIDRTDPRLRYLPATFVDSFGMQLSRIYDQGPASQLPEKKELFDRRRDLVARMAEAGVPLLAGTDTGTAYVLPGFALHDELAQLVGAGVSPMGALRAATLESARYLGLEHEQGTVEPGKIADLVLLDGDPLTDITNTTRIDAVVVRGCPVDRTARQRMLDDVRSAAAHPKNAVAPPPACPCGGH